MTSSTQIVVRVAADGSITAQTRGVTGTACLDYIAVLEDMLEATTTDSAYTEDYQRTTTTETYGARNELGQS